MTISAELARLRVGTGVDVHGFSPDRPLILAGVEIPYTHGLDGHSDADLVAHAVTDALLGGAGMADIGTYFPSEDASLEGADSMELLRQVIAMLHERGCQVLNVDCVVVMQAPKLGPFRGEMIDNLAAAIGVEVDRITVRATTTDHLGFIGRREGAAAIASALVLRGA